MSSDKRKIRFRRHESLQVMLLSAEYRIKFRRNLAAFVQARPEFLKLSTKDQRYIVA